MGQCLSPPDPPCSCCNLAQRSIIHSSTSNALGHPKRSIMQHAHQSARSSPKAPKWSHENIYRPQTWTVIGLSRAHSFRGPARPASHSGALHCTAPKRGQQRREERRIMERKPNLSAMSAAPEQSPSRLNEPKPVFRASIRCRG